MRKLFSFTLCVLLMYSWTALATAQQQQVSPAGYGEACGYPPVDCYYEPRCDIQCESPPPMYSSPPQCAPRPQCAPQPQQQPQQTPPQQAPPQFAPQPGYYAAPPQNGAFAGESRSVGVGGLALHFPAMTLKLPTVELPSLFHIRRNPQMMIEPAQAPFVQQAPVAQAAIISPPVAAPQQAPNEPQQEPEEKPEPQRQPEQLPCPYPYPCPYPRPHPPGCDGPPACASHPTQLDSELRQREQQIQLLEQQVRQLTQLTQQLVAVVAAEPQANRVQQAMATEPLTAGNGQPQLRRFPAVSNSEMRPLRRENFE